jgi:cell division protein FtsW (lipid II flippase)
MQRLRRSEVSKVSEVSEVSEVKNESTNHIAVAFAFQPSEPVKPPKPLFLAAV